MTKSFRMFLIICVFISALIADSAHANENKVNVALAKRGVSATAGSGRVVDTKFPTDDLLIADFVVTDAPYTADNTGRKDATAAFQAAIDAAASQGGGTVYAPNGTYRFDGQLVLKSGVTLRGDWAKPTKENKKVRGTTLAVYSERGKNEEGKAFIRVHKVSGLNGLNIWYPEQRAANITPYPATIELMDAHSCGYTVYNINLVNAYRGIIPAKDDGARNCYELRNIYGTPLKQGIVYNYVLDIVKGTKVYFSPDYWEQSGLPNAPASKPAGEGLRKYLLKHATGLITRRNDWFSFDQINVDGYHIGVRYGINPKVGPSNGVLANARLINCMTGLLIDDASYGLTVSGGEFIPYPAKGAKGVHVKSAVKTTVILNDCTIKNLTVDNGTRGNINIENSRLKGKSLANGGYWSIINSDIDETSTIAIGEGNKAMRVLVKPSGKNNRRSTLHKEMVKYFAGKTDKLSVDTASAFIPYSKKQFPYRPTPRPETKRIFNVRDYGAKGDEATDDTAAFEKALSNAGKWGGGTVYFPAGRYVITGHLRVPEGVELRGVYSVTYAHTMVPGSCLIAKVPALKENQKDSEGTPFITLEKRSGLAGFVVWYPNQEVMKYTRYPWTVSALGPEIWMRNVCLANPWQAIDLASAKDNGGHILEGVTGAPIRRGLFVDNAKSPGYVDGTQFVSHYWQRNDSGLKPVKMFNSSKTLHRIQNRELETFSFGDCADEWINNSFAYATRKGYQFKKNFKGQIFALGTDSSGVAFTISDNADVDMIDILMVPIPDPKIGVVVKKGYTGRLNIYNAQIWGFGRAFEFHEHKGQINISQFDIMNLNDAVIKEGNLKITALSTSVKSRINPKITWVRKDKNPHSYDFGPKLSIEKEKQKGPVQLNIK